MAKTSVIEREKRRTKMAEQQYSKRKELKEIICSEKSTFEEVMEAQVKLQKLPRDGSKSRGQNRCKLCGRPRGVYKKFGLCRIHLRETVMVGEVPGWLMSSW